GKPARNDIAKQGLKKLRRCVSVCRTGEQEFDAALDSAWLDLEDACLYQSALNMKADFIITRNQKDFSLSSIRVADATEFFSYLEEHEGVIYQGIDWARV
ncbi:MAG: PIN domain-containing protein, partial [Eggerthellaceae bacterium]|nr:PIN domain-containing protein [Eggerthellaceae bacterium]